MRERVLLIIMLAFFGMFVLSGCGADKKGAAKNTVVRMVQTAAAKSQRVVYLMAGKIDAAEKADITSKITAKVAAISVDVGSIVKKGDSIINLDSRDLEAQVAQAQAALDSAGTNYQNAKNTYERNQRLFNAGLISKSQFEQYQTAFAVSEASSQSAQASLEFTKTQLGNGTIFSPISGVISARNINPGELATTGASLVTVINPDTIIVNAYLPAGLISKIKVGQKVVIKVSEIPDRKFNGEISVIDPVIDSKSKNTLVKVKFNDWDSILKPGMFAEIGLKN
jgi:HlyD family secretion protein